jgi:2-haloacid dehalogenase
VDVRALVFDVFGTVVDWRSGVAREAGRLLGAGIDTDSVDGLTRLKQKFVIASLSNGNVALLVDMAEHGGLPWDTVLSAELFGHYKPDPEVYDGAARLLDLPPEQIMMVAAHVEDLAGARTRGLRTAYVHRPAEKGPAAPPPETDPDADVSVASLTELADHLGV